MKMQFLLLAITLSFFTNGALAAPVTCSISITEGRGFVWTRHYTSVDLHPGTGLSPNTPDISKARLQVIEACKAGEKARSLGDINPSCDTDNRSPSMFFKCSTEHREIQFKCAAKPTGIDNLSIYGTGSTSKEASELAIQNCLAGENVGDCLASTEPCEENTDIPVKSERWSLHATGMTEPSTAIETSKLVPAEPLSPVSESNGGAAANAVSE